MTETEKKLDAVVHEYFAARNEIGKVVSELLQENTPEGVVVNPLTVSLQDISSTSEEIVITFVYIAEVDGKKVKVEGYVDLFDEVVVNTGIWDKG